MRSTTSGCSWSTSARRTSSRRSPMRHVLPAQWVELAAILVVDNIPTEDEWRLSAKSANVERAAPVERPDRDEHAERRDDQDGGRRDRGVEVAGLELRVDDERERLRPALHVAREHDRRPELTEGPRPGH